MTEGEWLACGDIELMLNFLGRNITDRKAQLFAVTCLRRLWDQLTDQRSREAVDATEAYAEGALQAEQLIQFRERAFNAMQVSYGGVDEDRDCQLRDMAALITLLSGLSKVHELILKGLKDFPAAAAPDTLRDMVGPLPFRAVTINPRWKTSTVVDLAQMIYARREFDRLPMLADALIDAGCADDDILGHCRSEGPHVRGCWVVDLLLGKQ